MPNEQSPFASRQCDILGEAQHQTCGNINLYREPDEGGITVSGPNEQMIQTASKKHAKHLPLQFSKYFLNLGESGLFYYVPPAWDANSLPAVRMANLPRTECACCSFQSVHFSPLCTSSPKSDVLPILSIHSERYRYSQAFNLRLIEISTTTCEAPLDNMSCFRSLLLPMPRGNAKHNGPRATRGRNLPLVTVLRCVKNTAMVALLEKGSPW